VTTTAAAVDFFWDPICPWAWITSRWVHEVAGQRALDVDWRFIALRIVNEDRDYEREFPARYAERHGLGLRLLRVAAAARDVHGRDAVGPLYTAFGTRIHVDRDIDGLAGTDAIIEILRGLDLDPGSATAADDEAWDEVVRADTATALERAGRDVGTPVITFAPPDGPSFFGPVISRIPRGPEAVELWDSVERLAHFPGFAELKRSLRERPQVS
jgi:2-hydroxychromene-2-carboxylate isomerase